MTGSSAPSVPGAAVLARCDDLARITAVPGRIDRFHLTVEHGRANALVASWMQSAGMRTWFDPAGNVCGRLEGAEPGLPAVVLGSHLDTVPDAGRYDGPLGVVLAIAAAERLRDHMSRSPVALEVVGFSDEEGIRFGTALMGSKAMAGSWDDTWWTRTDAAGTTVREAFLAFGLDPNRVREAARRPGDVVCYLEAHIEQGPELEAMDLPLGVVGAIMAARRFEISVLGEARHAGGTPYHRRRDALLGASSAIVSIERFARSLGVVATVGRMDVQPGGVNVIPGRVDFTLDLRAESDTRRDDAWARIRTAVDRACTQRGLTNTVRVDHTAAAVSCAAWLQDAVTVGIAAAGQDGTPPTLLSRAGHDAMAMAAVTDVGMLFVRCDDGISHSPNESVTGPDVAAALDALVATVRAVGDRIPPLPATAPPHEVLR